MFQESPHPSSPTPTFEGNFPHAPLGLPRLCVEIYLHPCNKRWTSFWIPHWQCNVFCFCFLVFFFFFFLVFDNFTLSELQSMVSDLRHFVISFCRCEIMIIFVFSHSSFRREITTKLRVFPFVFSPRNNNKTSRNDEINGAYYRRAFYHVYRLCATKLR